MFYSANKSDYEGKIAVIGEFTKIDGDYVILKVQNGIVKVQHKQLENYKTKYILVIGEMRNKILVEEKIYKIEDEFSYGCYEKLVKASIKHPEIF